VGAVVLATSDFVRYFIFPFVLLLVAGIAVPWLADRRDRKQKDREVQTELVSHISDTVLKFVIAIEFAVLSPSASGVDRGGGSRRPAPGDQDRHVEAYRTWAIETGVLHTKLEAYFPDACVAAHWRALEELLKEAYRQIDRAPTPAEWEETKACCLNKKMALIDEVLNQPTTWIHGKRRSKHPTPVRREQSTTKPSP
jgi:hypothetical protein